MAAPTRTAAGVRVALAGMAALAVPMGIGRFAFTPIVPMMQADAGLSLGGAAWLASANYLGTLVGALAAMTVTMSPQPAIRAGLVIIGLTTVAMGLERGAPLWVALRFAAGMATGWLLPFASAWALARLAPLRRPVLNATVFAGYGVGIASAGVICLGLMARHASSSQAWVILGVVALAVTAVMWPAFTGHDARPPGRDARLRGDSDAITLIACYGAFGFGYIVPATFLPVMARAAVDDPSVFGWAWPVFGITAAASTFAATGLATSLGNRRLWGLGHVLMAAGVGLPVIDPGIVSIMLSALLVGGTFTVVTMAGFQEARDVGGVHMIAALASAFAIGQIAGPIVVRVAIGTDGGLSVALLLACAVLVASAAALVRRPPSPRS